jgi:O-antigen/teichoic acid export membrane protein
LILNYLWIPAYGYTGSAWATFACYFSMCLISYLLGQKYYPVPYDLKKIGLFVFGSLFFYAISDSLSTLFAYGEYIKMGVNTLLLLAYVGMIFFVMKKNFAFLN